MVHSFIDFVRQSVLHDFYNVDKDYSLFLGKLNC